MKKLRVLGIMSGTSLDSIDYALCGISADAIGLESHWTVRFPAALRAALHRAARGDLDSWAFAQLHHDLGRFYANGARQNPAANRAQLAGLHGQTVFHNPARKNPATFQLGEPAYLAEALRVPVVSNFRVADLAAGGQGAPLATIFHQFVFGRRGRHVCVNNLGGISNVTSLDWRRGTQPRVMAFDTGPANMLIDFAMRHFTGGRRNYDRNGAWSARGSASETLLAKWLKHPFFKLKPPKSTGRELFGEPFFKEAIGEMKKLAPYDAVATFTEFTARSLALNYRLHLPAAPDVVILAGGGASNPALVAAIERHLKGPVRTSLEFGWDAQTIEPAAFALLAWLRFHQQPGNIPGTTGAKRPVLCGQISQP